MVKFRRRVLLQGAAAAGCAWLIGPRISWGNINIRSRLKSVAESLAQFLVAQGEHSVALGQFSGPPQLASTGGIGIAQVLSQELAALNIDIERRAKLGIEGSYHPDVDPVSMRPSARITVRVVDTTGAVLVDYTDHVSETKEVASILGLTVALDPSQPQKSRDEQLNNAIDEPGGVLEVNTLRADTSSPYGIEIWVEQGTEYEPQPLKLDEGLPFVDLKEEDLYAIRIINDSAHDAAVTISIDGVNLFAFSENKGYSNLILSKDKGSALVKGWFRTLEKSDAFKITSYADSAAAELLNGTSQIGTITVTFAACWPKGQKPPSDELKFRFAVRGSEELATGRGPSIEQKYEEAERVNGEVRSVLSIRYSK
jgi:hypothetical protein